MTAPRTIHLVLAADKQTDIHAALIVEAHRTLTRWEAQLNVITARYRERQAACQVEYLEQMEVALANIARLREVMGE